MTKDRVPPAQRRSGARAAEQPQDTSRPLLGTLIASAPVGEKGRAIGFVGSTIFHAALVAGLAYATMAVGQGVVEDDQGVALMEIPQETPPPPPPPPPPAVQMQTPSAPVALGYQVLDIPVIVPPEIPPPQIGVRFKEEDFTGIGKAGGRGDGDSTVTATQNLVDIQPHFTPMTVAPELTNIPEVQRALLRNYPPLLRDVGIGGTPVVWFLIDENGKVIKTQLSKSSGHAALDEAAIKVADVMKFSPALNHNQRVTVWVALPIVFKVH
jgi:protein TonB